MANPSNAKAYFLTNNEDEFARLNKQHSAVVLSLGGLYPASDIVRAILAPEEGKTKRVLDLGCGSAIWTTSVAKEYPHVQVIGLDHNPPTPSSGTPPNCTFHVGDIDLGLTQYHGQFDVVHARFLGGGIKGYQKMTSEMEKCLMPGGMMIVVDADHKPLARSGDGWKYYPPAGGGNENGSWVVRMMNEMGRAARLGGSDIPMVLQTLDKGVWDDELMDPETCGAANVYLPLGTRDEDADPREAERLQKIGELMAEDVKKLLRGFHPLLMKNGISEEELKEWSEQCDRELDDNVHPIYIRFVTVWGRRRAAPNEPAPRLSKLEEGSVMEPPRYCHFCPFYSSEEGFAVQEKLDQSRCFPLLV